MNSIGHPAVVGIRDSVASLPYTAGSMDDNATQTSRIPAGNLEVFSLIYQIENSLRELIIETLAAADGPKWYKTRLPGEVLAKYREGVSFERSIKWSRLIPHHPIYYVDFPHLRQIIINAKNWNSIFSPIFGRREIFEGNFVELESIRNRVAHNRKLSEGDIAIARGIQQVFNQILGTQRIEQLAHRCTLQDDIPKCLDALIAEIRQAYSAVVHYQSPVKTSSWEGISTSWWYDSDYLGVDILPVSEFFDAYREYCALPRGRGSGYLIEAWVKSKNLYALKSKANQVLTALLEAT